MSKVYERAIDNHNETIKLLKIKYKVAIDKDDAILMKDANTFAYGLMQAYNVCYMDKFAQEVRAVNEIYTYLWINRRKEETNIEGSEK